MQSNNTQYDLVIVGAGTAGLTAAAIDESVSPAPHWATPIGPGHEQGIPFIHALRRLKLH